MKLKTGEGLGEVGLRGTYTTLLYPLTITLSTFSLSESDE